MSTPDVTLTPEEEAAAIAALPPAPVLVGGTVTISKPVDVHEQPADFGSYTTITVPATAGWNQMVLPFDQHRARAILNCSGTGPVWIGTQAQVQANPPLGYQLGTGVSLPVMHKQAVWVGSAGATATLSVAIERWAA